ncbi:MAG: CDP-diacylglycerol--serine O-phosphatidyltransferase, partial [Prevotella sp.]|nr:CDP-diacylglycerol--serine O-phosphatidyltransferase [Prevotella sp.]
MGIKKHIPNTITCCNLVSGCIATTFAFAGNPKMAMFWIIMGAVFDFFDGMVARLLKVSSPIGKELDSLADDVTFGVAPSAIVFSELFTLQYPVLQGLQTYIPYCAFLIAAFSALRLAKFNLDDRQTTSFIGLPTPANALFWGSFIIGGHTFIESFRWGVPLILIMICLSCYLLVAEF